MPADFHLSLDSLLGQALSRPRGERQAFVEEACGSSERLRNELRELLQLHDQAGDFLERPALLVPDAVRDVCRGEEPGAVIGRYKLLEHIGEGGFGSVFMADQLEPVHRRVALKIIKLGMDTKRVVARFEAERQALALMDHPNIARVLDAGATESGRPYFVMELVRGTPITQFCDEHRLAVRQRLELFEQVCHAVQHAHTKGVIHRDLKPSNILAVRHDGGPVPKVIDFGIAKATGGRLTDKTLFTEFRELIGTPAYMSPEQAGMSDVDVDTRSDIYSLGVLLYELLTGTTPFNARALLDSGFDEMRRIVREVEPPTPSQRFDSLCHAPAPEPADASDASSSEAIARCRNTQSPALARLLHGDLDWIVMKCLEKDRARRYDTAVALEEDVRRHLANEPVRAGPPGAGYRLRKFVRRHKVGVAAGSLVAAALVLGMAGTIAGMAWALREQGRAEQRRIEADAARGLAESREKQTRQVSDFQAEMLRGIDVEEMGRGIKERLREQVRAALERQYVGEFPDRRKRTPEEIDTDLAAFDRLTDTTQAVDVARGVMDDFVLARAADALEKQFADQPLVRAQLHRAVGNTYRDLGLYAAAEPHLRAALEIRQREPGAEPEEVALSLGDLAWLLLSSGDHAGAEPLARESLGIMRRVHGEESVPVADRLCLLALCVGKNDEGQAERLLNDSIAMFRRLRGEGGPGVAAGLHNLANLLAERGDYAAAEAMSTASLAIGRACEPADRIAVNLLNLGIMHKRRGDYAGAEPLLREALTLSRTVRGDDHPLVARILQALAPLLQYKGEHAEAELMLGEALAVWRKRVGDRHRYVGRCLEDLAVILLSNNQYGAAEPLIREALSIARDRPEEDPARMGRILHLLAGCLNNTGKAEEALPLAKEAVVLYRQLPDDKYGEDYAHALEVLARSHRDLGQHGESVARLREALPIRRKGSSTDRVDWDLCLIAESLHEMRGFDDAEEAAREAVTIFRTNGDRSPKQREGHRRAVDVLVRALADSGKSDEAIRVRREFVEDCRRLLPAEDSELGQCLKDFAALLYSNGQHRAAEPVFQEALLIARDHPKEDPAQLGRILHHLADCLCRTGKAEEALRLAQEAVILYRQLPDDKRGEEYAHSLEVLARSHRALGQHGESVTHLREALPIRRQGRTDHVVWDLCLIAEGLHEIRGFDEAEEAAREAVTIFRTNDDRSPVQRDGHRRAVDVLVRTLGDSGKPDEAIRVQREFVEDCRRLLPADDVRLANALAMLGLLLVEHGKNAEAEPALRECVAIRERALGTESLDYWQLPNARSMLGGALAGQGAELIKSDAPAAVSKFTEAGPMLVESAEWLTRNADRIPEQFRALRLRQALERVARLYESWDAVAPDSGKADRAAEWRAQWERVPGR